MVAKETIWRVADVPRLTNTTMLPVIMSFNCLDGFFIYPASTYQAIEETMVRASNGGSVAAIVAQRRGLAYDQTIFRKILMDTLFKDGVRDLGRALMIAKRDFAYDPDHKYAAYGTPRGVKYLVYEMNLFGDPALRLPAIATPVPQALVVTTVRTGNQVKLSWDTVSKDIFGANPTVTNYGICAAPGPTLTRMLRTVTARRSPRPPISIGTITAPSARSSRSGT